MAVIRAWFGGIGLLVGAGLVGWAHVSLGGDLQVYMQPEALAVVFGGTLAALMVSFPGRTLRSAAAGVIGMLRQPAPALELLVPAFMTYARVARRHGLAAVEKEATGETDAYLGRALTLAAASLPADLLRHTLETEARICAEREEDGVQVLEAAAGYAPTLGIVGAVLGLMNVMSHLAGTAAMGPGIAAAFVATIYGVGAANLVFLPLATRLRLRVRTQSLRRELVMQGVIALRDGASPGLVEERLSGYLAPIKSSTLSEVA